MRASKRSILRAVASALCLALAACASVNPVAYSELPSSSQLTPNPRDDSGRVPYSYSVPVDWRRYRNAIIDPVALYRGPDQQFGDMPEADRVALANYMQSRFSESLRRRFTLVRNQEPGTLRVRLTLTGAATNTPVLATLSRFDIGGGIYNGVQSARDREGTLTGSVSYSVEVYDAAENRLIKAFIAKQYPNPWNLRATVGSLAASKSGIEQGADALLEQLR